MSLFGKAKFGNKSRNWFKLKDGEGIFRILPPMGDLREDGRWSVFYSIHYGYKNSEDEMRTFVSPLVKNRKTKMVEVRDAALERIESLKAQLDKAKKDGNTELVEQLLKMVGGKKSRFNLDNNHYMNVVDLQGNIGILKIRHRAKLALDAQIDKLRKNGIEPLDPENGRYFVFTRSGMGMDTTYQVTVYKKKLQVQGVGEVEQDFVHTIDDEFARRCLVQNKDGSYTYKEAARLDTLFKKPTAEEVERIVKEGAKAVDEILDTKATAASPQQEYATEDYSGLEDDDTPNVIANPAPAAAAPTFDAEAYAAGQLMTHGGEGIPEYPLDKTAAPVATTPAPATVATMAAPKAAPSTPKTTAQTVAEQTDEEFLKSLGL